MTIQALYTLIFKLFNFTVIITVMMIININGI